MITEEPTMEFRQVTRYIDYTHRDYSGCGVGLGSELKGGTTQVVVSVQQKWQIEYDHEVGFKAIRYEWRDLPIYTPKAGEGGYI